MDPLLNPYTPNAGATPAVVVGRDDQMRHFELLLARLERSRTEQSMIVTGLRGVGKTVLLREFQKKANDRGWAIVELEVSKHDDQYFRRQIGQVVRQALLSISPRTRWGARGQKAAAILRSFTLTVDSEGRLTAGWDVSGYDDAAADTGDLAMDLTELLVAVGEAAQDKGKGVVLLLDEIQFLRREQLEALIAGIHKCVQRQVPITMVGAGLPQIAELAGEAKSYAERLFKFPTIGELSEEDARYALNEPAKEEGAEFTDGALDLALELTGRYPYFIQELGYAVWGVAADQTITVDDVREAQTTYEDKLDSSFFRVRLDRATELEQAYMRAMAELGPQPQLAGDVARLLNRSSQQCAPTRSTLIEKGLLYTPGHGYAAFTVPHFDQFMKRSVPELKVPAIKPRKRRRK
ncbi:AAA family ATPase [Gordonia sp. HNM0687]|uniref:AAA family ATPase n=1 Tax=Gordonia mangrovi TaxID=2665643 RepID=A0A6L7GQV6_9ACTN|nr:ATP-binding protein [Gordonia mangrovi]MXP21953.1 AAA family ATPase [Gordonia mangrovi]UVF76314.1 ATP-binding protein [Gordonia mangrovi]